MRGSASRPSTTYSPVVSIILPAFNEELVLRRCLDSLIALDYTSDKFEILCGSDGSTDRTNEILHAYSERNANLFVHLFPVQRGKILILNDLVAAAKGEILFFVDADVTINSSALRAHVGHYADSNIGGVAGRLRIAADHQDGVFEAESTFLKLERRLRKDESKLFSTVGLYGGNYSMRRSMWKPLPDSRVYDDFHSVLLLLEARMRLIYEDAAIATEPYSRTYRDEFKRKTRNASRCLYTLKYFPHLLWRPGPAFLIWPHKILRWFAGYFFVGMLGSSILASMTGASWLTPVVWVQLMLLSIAIMGWFFRRSAKPIPVLSSVYWFALMNVAFMRGVYEFLFSKQELIWSQTTRFRGEHFVPIESEPLHH